jgi:MFS family permease
LASASGSPSEAAEQQPERLAAFRSPQFTLFWSALAISAIGSRATLSANLWQLLQLTDSAALVGAVGLSDAAALLLLTPLGGLFADRLERRTLLQVTQVLACSVSTALWLGTLFGVVQPGHIYLAVALFSAASTFELPVRQAMLPTLVPRSALVSALTLSAPIYQVAGLAGPALAGLLIAAAGVAPVYLVDALTYLALVISLAVLHVPRLGVSGPRPGLLASFTEGIGYVRHRPLLWQLMLLDFAATLFGAYRALLPVIARDVLGAGAEGYGLLSSAVSAGALIGSGLMIRLGKSAISGRAVLAATAAYSLVAAGLGQVQVLALAVLATALLGGLDAVGATVRATLVQLETPDELRGRVSAFAYLLARGGPALGQALLGSLATALGIPAALALGASVPFLLASGLAGFGRTLREHR